MMKCKYCQYPYDCKYYKNKDKDKNMQFPQNNLENIIQIYQTK